MKNKIELGRYGEDIALQFLKDKGYKIVVSNYRCRLGQIDIIARERGVLCFIEVKTRYSQRYGMPSEAISQEKQKRISKTALFFLKNNRLLDSRARFDVVSIYYGDGTPRIELIKNAFELDSRYT